MSNRYEASPPIDDSSLTGLDSDGCSYHPTTKEDLSRIFVANGVHLSPKDLDCLHVDEFQAELEVISQVLAYFDISSKRLIDEIPLVFETVFVSDFGEQLGKDLTTKLKLVGDMGLEHCTRYCQDESDMESRRRELTRMSTILNEARETIDRFFR